jgi:DNA-binding IclR family transcriptional regulator
MDALLAHGPMTPADIGEAIGIPRTSAYRLVQGLNAAALTEPQANGAIDLSLRWLHLADAAEDALSEWRGAHTLLEDLVAETQQTAFLSVPRGHRSVCIESVTAPGSSVLVVRRGFTAPLHAGAPGRALLALRGDATEYLKLAPFTPLVPGTLTTADQLMADISQTRQRGYAVAVEDVIVGMATISMPIYDHRRQIRGCVSLGGLASEVQERERELVEALRSGVRSFEATLAASLSDSPTTKPN